ncbi:LysR family transcriptional regulator [Alteribacillus sp. HJP-4]|uniref:LysR family transcriptional regulator n=1 Tax=Alteribacillus sp. HJP-4 TaxID=2775394 RepID=UPI0035CD0F89
MELRHLLTLKTIVEEGGFKKAAEELGYAQSSITAHIKDLESELGQPLFDRLGKNVTLTQAGKNFLPYAHDIIELYSQSKAVLDNTGEPSGQLTIGASESLMIYWLPELIMEFMEKYPKVELVLKSIHYDNLSAQLQKGDIDAAVLVESSEWTSSELTIHELKREKLSIVRPAEKRPDVMLVTEYSCSWRPIVESYLKNEQNQNLAKIELPSVEAIKKCVLCGLGKSMLPRFVVKDEVNSGALLETQMNSPSEEIGIYAAYHNKKWLSANLEAFLEMLQMFDLDADRRSVIWKK